MKYKRFEEVPAWQTAVDLAVRAFGLTQDPAFRRQGDIANQLQNSDIKGQRFLNEQTRKSYESKIRSDAFMERLQQMNANAARERQAQRKQPANETGVDSPPPESET